MEYTIKPLYTKPPKVELWADSTHIATLEGDHATRNARILRAMLQESDRLQAEAEKARADDINQAAGAPTVDEIAAQVEDNLDAYTAYISQAM